MEISPIVSLQINSKTFQEATMNWGYKTVPQNHLKGQQIDYSRGKGLGGSTAINFSCLGKKGR